MPPRRFKLRFYYKLVFASVLVSFFFAIVFLYLKLSLVDMCNNISIERSERRIGNHNYNKRNFVNSYGDNNNEAILDEIRQFLNKYVPDKMKLASSDGLIIDGTDDEYSANMRLLKESQKFQNEFKPFGDNFLFSAYYDDRVSSINNNEDFITAKDDLLGGWSHQEPIDGCLRCNKTAGKVRVIAMMKSKIHSMLRSFYCYFADEKIANLSLDPNTFDSLPNVVEADVYRMCENHGRRFGGYIISCPLQNNKNQTSDILHIPSHVFLIYRSQMKYERWGLPGEQMILTPKNEIWKNDGKNKTATANLAINTTENNSTQDVNDQQSDFHGKNVKLNKTKFKKILISQQVNILNRRQNKIYSNIKYRLGVCVAPIFQGILTALKLIEFFIANLQLGVEHFIVYVQPDLKEELQDVLMHYKDRGTLTYIPWKLPLGNHSEIWNFGQLLAVNDCLYRFMYLFDYLAFLDLDEFIIPNGKPNWNYMIANLENDTQCSTNSASAVSGATFLKSRCAGFSFSSAFIPPYPTSYGSMQGYNLESDLRVKKFSKVRTKVIVNPRLVMEMGIHHVSKLLDIQLKNNFERNKNNTNLISANKISSNQMMSPVLLAIMKVPSDLAYIHHFRPCTNFFEKKMNCYIFTTDRSFFPLLSELRVRIFLVLWHLHNRHLKQLGNETGSNQFLVI